MQNYVVEFLSPSLTKEQGEAITHKIREVAASIPELSWLRSNISQEENKIYSYFESPSPELLHEHAKRANLTIDQIRPIERVFTNQPFVPREGIKRYVVERTVPQFSDEQWQTIGEAVSKTAEELPGVTWIKSSISESCGKTYCEFAAPSPELLREHARRANLPVDRVCAVDMEFDPTMFR